MIKAIIFDCFGVLLTDVNRERHNKIAQTDPVAAQAIEDVFEASNRGKITREESARRMGEILHVDPAEILATSDAGEVRNQALVDFIKTLQPTYKLAMLSNVRGRASLDRRFNPNELDELFEVVVASGDVGIVKPERQIYELTAEKLGVDPQDCVMIDDIPEYCDGAEAAGMSAIHFLSTEQCIADLSALIDRKVTND